MKGVWQCWLYGVYALASLLTGTGLLLLGRAVGWTGLLVGCWMGLLWHRQVRFPRAILIWVVIGLLFTLSVLASVAKTLAAGTA